MLNELLAIVNENRSAIIKLTALNDKDTADIMQMIRDRQTQETRYNSLRIQRQERVGMIYAYNRINTRLEKIIAEMDVSDYQKVCKNTVTGL